MPPGPRTDSRPPQGSADQLDLPRGTALPQLCVKCGSPGPLELRRESLTWVPAWTYALLIVGLIPGALIQAILTQRAEVALPICAPCNARWKVASYVRVLSIIAPVVVGVAGMSASAMAGNANLMFASLAAMLVGLIAGPAAVRHWMLNVRQVRPTLIDKHRVVLRGVAPAVMTALRGR